MLHRALLAIAIVTAVPLSADAAEVCGNSQDDDGDGLTDEGCFAQICESPLSCGDTGMVSPLTGSLRYNLAPDVSPRVPFGPGIGLRRTFQSQFKPGSPTPPTFQAAGTKVDGTGSISAAWPTHQAGDVALLIVETAGTQAASLSSPQGFVAVTGSPQGDNVDINGSVLTVYWKRATTSSEAAPTVADSGDHQLAQILTFRNVIAAGDPWDVTAGSATSGTGAITFSIPGATTTVPNALVVAIVVNTNAATASAWKSDDLTSLTERSDVSTTAGNDGGIAVVTGVKTMVGAYGATTGDFSVSSRYAGMSIALRPEPPAWRKPLGERWQHTYMTWLDRWTTPNQVVIHTSRGQDVTFSYSDVIGGWVHYLPQAGFKDKFQYVRLRVASPNEYELRMLTGETVVYNAAGKLAEIWDTLATPQKVLIAHDGNGQVSTVTDASTKRRLLFTYTGAVLTSVAFQLNTGSWTTQHTTSYGFTSGNFTSATIGGASAQTNVYTSGYLTAINDAAGNNLVTFAYDSATAGKVVRVDTPRGMVGYEYSSTRAACTAKTVLHFHRGNTTSCNVDGDCGSGFLCGGKTGSGSTGMCFRAARCLTVTSPSDDLITSIAALGPAGESCDGMCLDVLSYVWDTASGALNLAGVQDPSTNYTTTAFNSNGLPTRINYGDTDSNPNNTLASPGREMFLFYSGSFPGKLTETRHQTAPELWTGGTCSASDATYCTRTQYTYNTNGKLATVTHTGNTMGYNGTTLGFSASTSYTYDSKGRLTQLDGASPEYAKTTFEYDTDSGDPKRVDFLETVKRYEDATSYLTETTTAYDFWGNPTTLKDANNVVTCLVFDTARGYLKERRQTMAGQTDCSSPNAADLTTAWLRDSALRLTKLTRPDGSCEHYAYDTRGRLENTRRRDDCTAGSAGESEQFLYSLDGQLTKVETLDAAGDIKRRKEMTYFDSRRLEKMINPVDTSKWTGLSYDNFGLVNEVNGGGNLNKSRYERTGTEARVTTEKRYRDASNFDAWNLLHDWLGLQKQVTDGDSKVTYSTRDDRGFMVKLANPDLGGYPTIRVHDDAGRLTYVRESLGGSVKTHGFTYDKLRRTLSADYDGACPSSSGAPEIQYTYDSPPVTCPVSGSCQKTTGRLAYVKITLMCDASQGDKTLDQETWYSYDDAGRMIKEHIRDDSGRAADHVYAWTKNGALKETTTPAGVVLGATFGSAGGNSDTDRITALWRVTTGTPVIDNVLWNPYGPLKQYNQFNWSSSPTPAYRTKITRNLAYRITQVRVEKQDGTNNIHQVDLNEDAAGRITKRDYYPNSNGVQDSYFVYDHQDRVLCERTTSGSTCPTDGTNTKNSHSQSPPFQAAGDWKRDLRPIAGSTCMINDFTLTTNTHQIATVGQPVGIPASPTCTPVLGTTTLGHDSRGNRSYDDNTSTLTNDRRDYTYDMRRNVINVQGKYYTAGTWRTYDVASAFDHQNRRVFKSFYDHTTTKTATWFFYYDAYDRLVEVRHTPDISASSTYSVFQLFWLGDRLVVYWQTDYPSVTTSKRYVGTDESGRPIDMWDWPASGNTTRVWAINPRAWGMDTNGVGPTVFQPILFAGQYQDPETTAWQDVTTMHRPGVALNGFRTYDPFTGSYLQVDPLVDSTWSTYVYVQSDPIGKSDPRGLAFNDLRYYQSAEYFRLVNGHGTGGTPQITGSGCTDGSGGAAVQGVLGAIVVSFAFGVVPGVLVGLLESSFLGGAFAVDACDLDNEDDNPFGDCLDGGCGPWPPNPT